MVASDVPSPPKSELHHAQALIRGGRLEEAGRVLTRQSDSVGGRIEAALVALVVSKAAEPIAELARDTLRAYPNAPLRTRALLVQGIAEHRLQRDELAFRALIECAALAEASGDLGSRIDALRAMGTAHAWRGRHAQAVLQLQLALADATILSDLGTIATILGELASTYVEAGQYGAALALLQRQEQLRAPVSGPSFRLRQDSIRLRALVGVGQLSEAIALAGNLAEAARALDNPHVYVVALRDLATCYLRLGRLEEAAAALVQADTLLPDDPDAFPHLALRALRIELLSIALPLEAARDATQLVAEYVQRKLIPGEVSARLLEADLLLRAGQTKEAEVTLRMALVRARLNGLDRFADDAQQALDRLAAGKVDDEASPASLQIGGLDGEFAPSLRFIVLEKLGSGASGAVFRAFDVQRARFVALKRVTLKEPYSSDERIDAVQRIRAEFEAACRVAHPGIARMLSFGSGPDGCLHLVQELISGPSLRQVFGRKDLLGEAKILCLHRLALSLDALHRAGVAHLDIKPDNILCPSLDRPVIVDFGISKMSGEASPHFEGTVGYAAPEQVAVGDVDVHADLYALGLIAFEWFSGRLPHGPASRAFPALVSDLRLLGEDEQLLAREAGMQLVELVTELLAETPYERPTAVEAARRLEEIRRTTWR